MEVSMQKSQGKIVTIILFLASFVLAAQATAAPTYRLVSSKSILQVGEQFAVDMILDNAEGASFVALQCWLRFDPTFLRVIDPGNDGSWLTSPDPNISDAAYHAAFPLSDPFSMVNAADNSIGEIDYQAAIGITDPILTSSGTFARIRFETLNTTSSTEITFQIPSDLSTKNTKIINEDGLNIFGGFTGAQISVVPEPTTLALFGLGLAGVWRSSRKKLR
ncbi:MAG: PEP-CTERM sorting domain-containing protein [Candidatus Omnitrophica bacterium]|nr:PEP-CTERM sorting domain-containing protein [Candidatus Omnitrophota bacterium]